MPVCNSLFLTGGCCTGTTIPSAFAEGVPAAKQDEDGKTHSVTKPQAAASQPQRASAPEDGPQRANAPEDGPPEKNKDNKSPSVLPDVATLLDTIRKRLEALNGPELPRI